MPHLIQGHVRFTENDFILSDYQAESIKIHQGKSSTEISSRLKVEAEHLVLMKEPEIVQVFNTEKNIKDALSNSLAMISALAEREGYTLTDLMR
jgi:hypothetical protein